MLCKLFYAVIGNNSRVCQFIDTSYSWQRHGIVKKSRNGLNVLFVDLTMNRLHAKRTLCPRGHIHTSNMWIWSLIRWPLSYVLCFCVLLTHSVVWDFSSDVERGELQNSKGMYLCVLNLWECETPQGCDSRITYNIVPLKRTQVIESIQELQIKVSKKTPFHPLRRQGVYVSSDSAIDGWRNMLNAILYNVYH